MTKEFFRLDVFDPSDGGLESSGASWMIPSNPENPQDSQPREGADVSLTPEAVIMEAIGEAGIRRLVAAFYRRVREDDLIGVMYPEDDWAGAETRLADFLAFRFGGNPKYLKERGHPRLRMRHAPFPVDRAARDRWMALMDASIAETEVPSPAAESLHAFFAHVADFMINRAEPNAESCPGSSPGGAPT